MAVSREIILCEHQERDGRQYPGCGAKIILVTVIPEVLIKGTKRKKVPLDAVYDPESLIPPSHAVAMGGATCRPLRLGERPDSTESAAITHFATCPHRRPL